MTNFIFKSQRGLIKNVDNKLEMILFELRHARTDNVMILALLHKLTINSHLQKQVNDYYEEDVSEPPKEQEQDLD